MRQDRLPWLRTCAGDLCIPDALRHGSPPRFARWKAPDPGLPHTLCGLTGAMTVPGPGREQAAGHPGRDPAWATVRLSTNGLSSGSGSKTNVYPHRAHGHCLPCIRTRPRAVPVGSMQLRLRRRKSDHMTTSLVSVGTRQRPASWRAPVSRVSCRRRSRQLPAAGTSGVVPTRRAASGVLMRLDWTFD